MLSSEHQQRNFYAFLSEKREELPFSPPQESLLAMLDTIPDGFIYSSPSQTLYVNKVAQEKWGVTDTSGNFPFDPNDPETEKIAQRFIAGYNDEETTIHYVHSIDSRGTHIPTKVSITITPENTITVQIADVTSQVFATEVRQALHDLNGIATLACGGQQIGLDTQEGRELVEQGLTNLFAFTKKLTPLHEQARSLQGTTPSHI
jgi:hypothetical protein